MSYETAENLAGAIAGLLVCACMTVLFVAMSAPVVETAQKMIA